MGTGELGRGPISARFFFKKNIRIYLLIFGCIGSLLLLMGFL